MRHHITLCVSSKYVKRVLFDVLSHDKILDFVYPISKQYDPYGHTYYCNLTSIKYIVLIKLHDYFTNLNLTNQSLQEHYRCLIMSYGQYPMSNVQCPMASIVGVRESWGYAGLGQRLFQVHY